MKTNWLKDCVEACNGIREYSSNGIQMTLSNAETTFPRGHHSHDDYEFIVVRNKELVTFCNKKEILVRKGYVMPFNSNDIHGQSSPVTVNSFLCLNIDSKLVEKVAAEAFNFTGKPIFKNISFRPTTNLNFYLGEFIDEVDQKEEETTYLLSMLSRLIVVELFRASENNVMQNERRGKSFILRGKRYLDENYHADFNLEEAANAASMNKYNFIRLFTKRMGITPKQYYLKTKIEKAKSLILMGEMTLTDIAYELGYSSQSHFSMHFKKVTGMTPKEFKTSLQY